MQRFIGVKLIAAVAMTRLAYNKYRGWQLPADEDGADEGYLVEYLDGGKPNHPNHVGYISWSPTEQFESAYRPTSGMTFGLAIEAIKRGERVARAGWNGKGMWVAISCDGSRNVPTDQLWSKHAAEFAQSQGGFAEVQPCLIMKNAQGKIQMGWAATQSDMLAEDWAIVGESNNVVLQPHQQRVVDEKSLLDEKANALSRFIGCNPAFESLDAVEQERLKEQNDVMWQYSEILGARIAAFGNTDS